MEEVVNGEVDVVDRGRRVVGRGGSVGRVFVIVSCGGCEAKSLVVRLKLGDLRGLLDSRGLRGLRDLLGAERHGSEACVEEVLLAELEQGCLVFVDDGEHGDVVGGHVDGPELHEVRSMAGLQGVELGLELVELCVVGLHKLEAEVSQCCLARNFPGNHPRLVLDEEPERAPLLQDSLGFFVGAEVHKAVWKGVKRRVRIVAVADGLDREVAYRLACVAEKREEHLLGMGGVISYRDPPLCDAFLEVRDCLLECSVPGAYGRGQL